MPGVTGLAISADAATYGPKHGVYVLDDDQNVRTFLQKASVDELQREGAIDEKGQVFLDSGVVFFDHHTTQRLLEIATETPLDARIELYSDMLRAFKGGGFEDFDDYLRMPADDPSPERVAIFRRILWDALHSIRLRVYAPKGADFRHLGTSQELVDLVAGSSLFRRKQAFSTKALCVVNGKPILAADDDGGVVVNSVLETTDLAATALVEHSLVVGLSVGPGSIVSAVRGGDNITLGPDLVLQQIQLLDGRFVTIVLGTHDDVKAPYPSGTFLNQPWDFFDAAQVWHNGSFPERNLWNARLFEPQATPEASLRAGLDDLAAAGHLRRASISLSEIVKTADKTAEFQWRQSMERRVDKALVLSSSKEDLDDDYLRAANDRDSSDTLLSALDAVPKKNPELLIRMAKLLAFRRGVTYQRVDEEARSLDGKMPMVNAWRLPLEDGSKAAALRCAARYAAAAATLRGRPVPPPPQVHRVARIPPQPGNLSVLPSSEAVRQSTVVEKRKVSHLVVVVAETRTECDLVNAAVDDILVAQNRRLVVADHDDTADDAALVLVSVGGSLLAPDLVVDGFLARRTVASVLQGRPVSRFGDRYAASRGAMALKRREELYDTDAVIVVDSVLDGCDVANGATIVECDLVHGTVNEGAVAVGLRGTVMVPPNVVAQRIPLRGGRYVVLVVGRDDDLDGTHLFGRTLPFDVDDIWAEEHHRVLKTARIYDVFDNNDDETMSFFLDEEQPLRKWKRRRRVSIVEALTQVDVGEFVRWSDAIATKRAAVFCTTSLLEKNHHVCLLPALTAVPTALKDHLASTLEDVALTARDHRSGRALALIAELYGQEAAIDVGETAELLATDELDVGIKYLRCLRQAWQVKDPTAMDVVAAHYAAASRALVRRAVAESFSSSSKKKILPSIPGVFRATAPGRIDLGGGWTDTPPICYEVGGCVANAAVTVDGERPIGCEARRLKESRIVLKVNDVTLEVETWADLADRHNPTAPGALLKCCVARRFSHTGERVVVPVGFDGVELRSWSRLPTGSGLGTSSILAGCVVAALDAALTGDLNIDKAKLVDDVSMIEQDLTTGGGWQDNVGGIFGGIKLAECPATLPIRVSQRTLAGCDISRHLVLVYTGAVRLAKNLLDNVVRRWHARVPEVVTAVEGLIKNAQNAADAITKEDPKALGTALDEYWRLKKIMAASDVEPPHVRDLITALRPHIYGASLCGAGGGGFLVVVTHEKDASSEFLATLVPEDLKVVTFHAVAIDRSGLDVVRIF